ncbi:two-component response regulator ORR25 isoform X3 [Lolium perenne]|uniref:two-component response regulator ORR25 isoform X3 n=1 Tax=Lolium perenne TaxID=4522 RepID=UPI0021F5EB59|nr:two-component response regulator ORR25-like isoform X3 [Lolium perenne]XP_051203874.1 two-component response regulator ORR25-like isoform X3 [Lolium perenne]
MDKEKLSCSKRTEASLLSTVLSVNGEKATMYRGIRHGACDYIVKPADIKETRNIWQHVVRKNHVAVIHNSSDSDDADQRVARPVIAKGGAKSKKCSKKKRNDGEGSDDNRGRRRNTWKKPRVSWTGELHNRFLEVVNRLGIDRAVPKAILQMMNVHNLSRENVASHLQKYRLFLKRVTDDPMKPNHMGDSSESRRNASYMGMSHQGVPPSSALCPCGSHNIYAAPPSILGPYGLSIQPRNWATGTVDNGGLMPDTGSRHASGPPVGPFANTSDQPMQDAFPRIHFRSGKSYQSVLRQKLMEVNTSVVPSSHPGTSSVAAEMPNGGQLESANQFPVQPREQISHFSGPMGMGPSAMGTHGNTQLSYLAGNCSNPWQNNVVPSSFAGSMVGAPLLPSSQVNVILPQINQTIFAPSSSEMAVFQNEQQNQMAGTNINNTTSVGVYSEQMTPLFNMASNAAPMEMTSANFSPMNQMMVNGGSTSSPSPNLQAGNPVAPPAQMANGGGSSSSALPGHLDSSVAPPAQMVNGGRSSSSALPGHLGSSVTLQTQMLNGGEGASGILPVQDDPAGQQASDDQPTYNTSNFLKDIFPSMASQDFNPDAVW